MFATANGLALLKGPTTVDRGKEQKVTLAAGFGWNPSTATVNRLNPDGRDKNANCPINCSEKTAPRSQGTRIRDLIAY